MMDTAAVLLLLLLLCFIFVAWWAARRDLNAAAAMKHSATLTELSEVQETVERLISVLDAKAAEVENRLAASVTKMRGVIHEAETQPHPDPEQVSDADGSASSSIDDMLSAKYADRAQISREGTQRADVACAGLPTSQVQLHNSGSIDGSRYAAVYALADEGIVDAIEIARRSGMGLAEVQMVLEFRHRRNADTQEDADHA